MSVTQVDHLARLQREMAAITKPLSDHYAELERTITTMETELNALRKARTQLRQTLRAIDPELVPVNGNRGGRPKKKDTQGNSEASLEKLMQWMQAHRDEINAQGGVHASGLVNSNGKVLRDDWDIPYHNQSKLSTGLRLLYERGILRFDHTGNGGAKYYTVV